MAALTDSYATYAQAAARATYLARTFDTAVQVKQDPDGWLVYLPTTYSYLLDLEGRPGTVAEPNLDSDDEEETPPNYYDEDKAEELRAELDEAQENWARSDEDGWFYPDDDDDVAEYDDHDE